MYNKYDMKEKINNLKNKEKVIILGIESSCDETSAAIVENGTKVLSNVVASQIDIHAKYGGVVPEIASRNHIEAIVPVLDEALEKAGVTLKDIDAIAVTYGAGLVGALLVGLNFAKGLAYSLNIPLIPTNHIAGHICANFIEYPELKPPFACLIVSGGHTAIVVQKIYSEHILLGKTQDDALGECFDKVARVLGLEYPGGPKVDKLAQNGQNNIVFRKHNALADSYDVSFSGLKTAVVNYVHTLNQKGEKVNKEDVCASFSHEAIDELVEKTIRGAKEHKCLKIALAGGVAGNSYLRKAMTEKAKEHGISVFYPPLPLCGDNAGMIASAGYFKLKYSDFESDLSIDAQPSLPIDDKKSFLSN